MASLETGPRVNGMDVAELREYIESVAADSTKGEHEPTMTARWVGGFRAAITSSFGGPVVFMGGDDEPGAMGMVMRALAACDVEVVVTKATLLGVQIRELTIEATGHFNVAQYLGVPTDEGSGYSRVSYVVHLKVDSATPEQVEEIRRALEASPVGDTLKRAVPVTFELNVG
jgi:uncharacterized OsmC-like protein